MSGRAAGVAVAFALAVWLGSPAFAAPATGSFSGRCTFSGPITPDPPITVVPKSGSHFSYDGTGTCTGTLDGTTVTSAPDTVTFTNVATLFDTCEFGPDLNLSGKMVLGTPADRAQFPVTISLARLAVAGPFEITTPGGGEGVGTATLTPPDAATGLEARAAGGIGTASLAGDFMTTSALIGTADPAPSTTPTITPAATTTATTSPAPARPAHCVASRRRALALSAPRGQRIVAALVFIDGHRVERLRGHRLTAVRLRPLTRGRHMVRIVTRTNRGQTRTIQRHYDICA